MLEEEEVQCGAAPIESKLYKIYERLKEKRKRIGFAGWWKCAASRRQQEQSRQGGCW